MEYVHAKVVASSRKETFKQKSKDHFEISVCEPAERNMANKRILELLALHFKISSSQIRIVNGHRSSSKLIVVGD